MRQALKNVPIHSTLGIVPKVRPKGLELALDYAALPTFPNAANNNSRLFG